MEAYLIDLRTRVFLAVDNGVDNRQKIADTFGVTTRWIRLLAKQRRETGSIKPRPHAGGWEPKFTPERLERLNIWGRSPQPLLTGFIRVAVFDAAT